MAQIKELRDPHGVVHEACKILPDDTHKVKCLESLAELADREAHRTRTFPKTRLHKLVGVKEAVYRADIVKTTGWRLHVQYAIGEDHLLLNDVLEGQDHDAAVRLVKKRKHRYQSP